MALREVDSGLALVSCIVRIVIRSIGVGAVTYDQLAARDDVDIGVSSGSEIALAVLGICSSVVVVDEVTV